MNNIECVIIKTEDHGDDEKSDLSYGVTTTTVNSENNNSKAPVNCFNKLFGVNSLNYDGVHIKTESKIKLEVTDFKNGHARRRRYRIEYKNKTPCTNLICKPEEFFDKNSLRDRLKCPNCYFLTDNKGNLKQHMKVHQRPIGDKFYHCLLCNFETKYKNSITGHVLRHDIEELKVGQKKGKK